MSFDGNKKPHVLFVVKDIAYFMSHRSDLAQYLLDHDVNVSVATDLMKINTFPLQGKMSNIIHLPFLSIKAKPWHIAFPTIKLLTFLIQKPEVIVFSVTLPATFLAGILCALTGSRQVILFAGLGNLFHGRSSTIRKFLLNLLRRISNKKRTRIIGQNQDLINLLKINGFSNKAILIPGSGIDEGPYVRSSHKRKSGRPLKILYLGRMLREKGVCEFIAAAKSLVDSSAEVNFILAGRTDALNPTSLSETELRNLIGTSTKLSWIGNIDDVVALLYSVDIVCLPSYHEGFPRSLLEGALTGCCLVASDIPGCREIVIPNKTGLLVKPKSAPDLATAMRYLSTNEHLIATMGTEARHHVLKNFTNKNILPLYATEILENWPKN